MQASSVNVQQIVERITFQSIANLSSQPFAGSSGFGPMSILHPDD